MKNLILLLIVGMLGLAVTSCVPFVYDDGAPGFWDGGFFGDGLWGGGWGGGFWGSDHWHEHHHWNGGGGGWHGGHGGGHGGHGHR